MIEPISSTQIAAHGWLAVFGAIVHALNAHRKWTSKSFLDFVVLIIMSSFTWVMFTILALHLFPSATYLVFAMSWAGWYLWVEWMGMVVWYLKKKVQ